MMKKNIFFLILMKICVVYIKFVFWDCYFFIIKEIERVLFYNEKKKLIFLIFKVDNIW